MSHQLCSFRGSAVATAAPRSGPPSALQRSASVSSAIWVDTPATLQTLASRMGGCSCIAVDLESHNVRSYYGFTCLIQISLPGGSDYLVDTIALWDHIGDVLGPVFADPDICKVFHACEGGDIAALHRDFRIFCVNVFDTQHAARLLGLPLGLGELLSVTVPSANTAGKTHSTTMSDWRVRPLTLNNTLMRGLTLDICLAQKSAQEGLEALRLRHKRKVK